MHGVVWNSPERINTHRKNIGERLLTDEEYEKCKKQEKKIKKSLKVMWNF